VVAGVVVYVGADDGNVYALDGATEAELWTFTTRLGVFSSPAVANGVVYVGSEDGYVYAFRPGEHGHVTDDRAASRQPPAPAPVRHGASRLERGKHFARRQ
jgi:outer membrane protein assembly factor BamB